MLTASAITAQPIVRSGPELQINTYTTGVQRAPAVGLSDSGEFVVVWFGEQDGSGTDIFARRLSPFGSSPVEFQVNTFTSGSQTFPALSMSASGAFVVVWQGPDGDQDGVFARRFDSDGTAQGDEFQVNTLTVDIQNASSVALSADGSFVVAWTSDGQDGSGYGVFAQLFDADGAPQATELQVNTYITGAQSSPSVASDDDGDFVIAWNSDGQDGSSYGVFARRFDAAGAPQGVEFRVNTYITGSQSLPAVSSSTSGDFVVAWTSFGQDGFSNGVFAQRFDAVGAPQGVEFRVNSTIVNAQDSPSVTVAPGGGFLIAWKSTNQDGNADGVFARRFDAAGVPQATELRVNTFVTGNQNDPSVASNANGRFVVAWNSLNQDGSSYGIFAQQLKTPALLDLDGNGIVEALTDGRLALRYLFGFTGSSLTDDAIGSGCTRCEAAAIESYVPTLHPAAPIRVGGEFQVNAYTSNSQSHPAVAADGAGDFVVTWDSFQGGSVDIFARRFLRGEAQASEFQVNTSDDGFEQNPAVAATAAGEFVVVWPFFGNVFARGISREGDAVASEFVVNVNPTGAKRFPAVAAAATGDFVVTWAANDGSEDGIFARRFSSAGTAVGVDFQVNSVTQNDQGVPSLVASADGAFVIAWQSEIDQNELYDIVAVRRFSSTGEALADEFQASSSTVGYRLSPAIASSADGDFVVAWLNKDEFGQDDAIFARRFSSTGSALGNQFMANSFDNDSAAAPTVAKGTRDFLIAWGTEDQDGDYTGVFARRFSSAGIPQAAEFQVNTFTAGDQRYPSLAGDGSGGFVVAWTSTDQDGSELGIFAQRLAFLDVLDVDGNGARTPLTDGLLLLRFLFGFTESALTSGAVGDGCTRCDAETIGKYLEGLADV